MCVCIYIYNSAFKNKQRVYTIFSHNTAVADFKVHESDHDIGSFQKLKIWESTFKTNNCKTEVESIQEYLFLFDEDIRQPWHGLT